MIRGGVRLSPRLANTSPSSDPSLPVSFESFSGPSFSCPVTSPLPMVQQPKLLLSSQRKAATLMGSFSPASLARFNSRSPAMTPATPSYRPPWITESRWDPIKTYSSAGAKKA